MLLKRENWGAGWMHYRPDIDGLRALAIVPVVFFHAHIAGFGGGYVGVDIFFVISGFLITTLIQTEIKKGQFSLLSFYERRARRILPALFFMIFATAVAGAWFLFPDQYEQLAKSIVATVLFSSNVFFWRQSGYFDVASSEKPLLHTWSLSVEEQFYIFFPILLVSLARLKTRWTGEILAALALLSFTLMCWTLAESPASAFYLAPMRAWQLLMGAVLAVNIVPQFSRHWVREIEACLGVVLIGISVFYYSQETLFPGWNALPPCLGAAFLIHAGAGGSFVTSKILAASPFVFLGLISYSLYLWHWPILVFLPYWETTSSPWFQIGAAVVVAILSWRFIERPFRRIDSPLGRREICLGASAAAVISLAFGLLCIASDGLPGRVPANAAELASYSQETRRKECFGTRTQSIQPELACVYGADASPSYALWGDSHADALMEAIGEVADLHHASVKFFGSTSCPPLLGVESMQNPRCSEQNKRTIAYLLTHSEIRVVILVARYAVYVEGYERPEEAGGLGSPYIYSNQSPPSISLAKRRRLFEDSLRDTVARLIRSGKTVALVYPVPEAGFDVPVTLARIAMRGGDLLAASRYDHAHYVQRQKYVFDALNRLGTLDKILRVYPHRKLCNGNSCLSFANGRPLYRDDDHLSLAGGRFISPVFEPIFAENMSAAARAENLPRSSAFNKRSTERIHVLSLDR